MMGVIEVMDRKGETKIIWDSEKPAEVANAKRTFDDLTKQGYWAHKAVGKDGATGERITEFDPEAERMVFHAQMKGG